MPLFRATFFFKDDNGRGWSETFYNQKASLADVRIAAMGLALLRVQLLGTTAELPLLRVSDDLVKRDALIGRLSLGNRRPISSVQGAAASANLCLNVRLQSGTLFRRNLSMRGIPDDVSVNSGKFALVPGFSNAFIAWARELKAQSWAIKAKDPLAPVVSINNIGQALDGTVTITSAGAHGVVQNDPITITGVRGATALNGSWNVFSSVDATNFTIKCSSVLKPWLGGGKFRGRLFALVGIDEIIASGISHRITGRPFDQQRGRRPARSRI